jgi:small subunit ribosomal protein S6
MATHTPTYDLVLILDLAAEDDARAKILADTRATITAAGTLIAEQPWGVRTLAYPIDHRTQAEYHLFQFSGPPSLIASLEHTLRITDGVIRHRVIKQRGAVATSSQEPAPATAAPVPSPPAESDPELVRA